MQTIIELSDEQVRRLDERSAIEKARRQELVGRAVDAYLERIVIPPHLAQAFGEPGKWPELDAVFGILKDHREDTFAFLRRVGRWLRIGCSLMLNFLLEILSNLGALLAERALSRIGRKVYCSVPPWIRYGANWKRRTAMVPPATRQDSRFRRLA